MDTRLTEHEREVNGASEQVANVSVTPVKSGRRLGDGKMNTQTSGLHSLVWVSLRS